MSLKQYQIALLIVRIIIGITFFLHGSQKIFGWFGGPGLAGFAKWLSGYGLPTMLAYLAAFAEFAGGCMMIIGLATELGALMTIPVMLGAIFMIHGTKHYFVQDKGFEYPFVLIVLAIAIIIGGPGMWALWDPFKYWRN